MFDGGVTEQLHRFIVSPPPHPSPPAPATRAVPFPLSNNPFMNSVLGDDNNNHKIIHQTHHHHHHHHNHGDIKDGGTSRWMDPTDHDRHHHHHPWSIDEVIALLRLRSAVENCFPGFTWEHISRKLREVGFKRTPQECKEKFEDEERRHFNNSIGNDHISDYSNGKAGSIRMFSELEEFYHHGHEHHGDDGGHVSSGVGHSQKSLEEPRNQAKDKMGQDVEEEEGEEMGINQSCEVKSGNIEHDGKISASSSSEMVMMMMMTTMMKKRKRKRKRERENEGLEMLKGFCEGIVRKMIAQQEEMHRKIIGDMVKRDEEKIEKEEAWKKHQLERINKEHEIRAHEQTLASTIVNFITKFTSSSEHHDHHNHHHHHHHGNKVQSPSTSRGSSSLVLPSNNILTSSSSQTLNSQIPLSFHHTICEKSQEPISVQTLKTKTHNPKPPKSDENCDLGKRWSRDEVLSLVNIRCSTSTMVNDDHHHHHHEDQHNKDRASSSKAPPLWERISKKMLELGYKRSAKRCKEKWENINKYFRKTRDVNRKRPLDSRTCPYFHQLSALYSQCSLAGADDAAVKLYSGGHDPESRVGSSNDGPGDDPNVQVTANGDDHEKNTVQASDFRS